MSEPVWVPGDWAKVRKGDRVRLEFEDDIHEFTAVHDGEETRTLCRFDPHFKSEGWSLFVEAPPAPVLPTEPNTIWADRNGYPWFVTNSGNLVTHQIELHGPAELAAPFTRLEPRHETAKAILDAVEAKVNASQFGSLSALAFIRQVAAEFGVEVTD